MVREGERKRERIESKSNSNTMTDGERESNKANMKEGLMKRERKRGSGGVESETGREESKWHKWMECGLPLCRDKSKRERESALVCDYEINR